MDRLPERVEVDRRRLDVLVVDKNGVPLGYPRMTCYWDKESGDVLGWELSYDPLSEVTPG